MASPAHFPRANRCSISSRSHARPTPDAGGEHDEWAVLERVLEHDRLYVMARGYAKFALFNAIVQHGSGDVCRLRENRVYAIADERPLTVRGLLPHSISPIFGRPVIRP